VLAVHPAPDEEARLRFLQAVAAGLHQITARGQRTELPQRYLFRARCRELGHPALLEVLPPEDVRPGADEQEQESAGFSALRGLSVALYTLTESAGQRVKAFLEEVCPGVAVEVSHDKVCTERLKAAARNADVFVMATASAKHAATGCIEAHRPDSRPLLRPAGKGSASMLSALAAYVAGH
jgi:hypothetical protein